jgi:hypothetical protein
MEEPLFAMKGLTAMQASMLMRISVTATVESPNLFKSRSTAKIFNFYKSIFERFVVLPVLEMRPTLLRICLND